MTRFSLILIASTIATSVSAQIDVEFMCYNLLNFPQGGILNRQDSLKKIIDFEQPDVLLIQELKTSTGLDAIVETSFSDVPGDFTAAPFQSQQSNPGTGNPLQQALVYNNSKLGLASTDIILTPVRDVNEYKMFFRDQEAATGGDTTFLYVYVTHLKSSQGQDNEDLRQQMAQAWRNHIEDLPSDAYVLIGGDFNLYSSFEEAYETLLGEGESIEMNDPIDSPGVWTDSGYPFKEILTQSTRENQVFGDGAGGGLDDRFDFMLVSDNLMDQNETVHFETDSYYALGNNGTCYDQNITDCDNGNDVPFDILRAMYYLSDHLPVMMTISADLELNISAQVNTGPDFKLSAANGILRIHNPRNEAFSLLAHDIQGRLVLSNVVESGTNSFDLTHVNSGIIIVQLSTDEGHRTFRLPLF